MAVKIAWYNTALQSIMVASNKAGRAMKLIVIGAAGAVGRTAVDALASRRARY